MIKNREIMSYGHNLIVASERDSLAPETISALKKSIAYWNDRLSAGSWLNSKVDGGRSEHPLCRLHYATGETGCASCQIFKLFKGCRNTALPNAAHPTTPQEFKEAATEFILLLLTLLPPEERPTGLPLKWHSCPACGQATLKKGKCRECSMSNIYKESS